MIKLFVDSKQAGAAGSVKLRWCVSKDVLEQTKDCEVYLLIFVVADGKSTRSTRALHQAVQLNAGATYISFMYAGINRVFARVFYGTKKEAESLLDHPSVHHCSIENGGWEYTVATEEAIIARDEARLAELILTPVVLKAGEPDLSLVESTQLNQSIERHKRTLEEIRAIEKTRGISDPINVPADCFAKEWPDWLNGWVNWMGWNGRALDECNRRRRALFSFTIQPFIVLMSILIRLLAAICSTAVGFGVNYVAIVRPFKYDLREAVAWTSPPFWFPGDERRSPARIALAPFCPAFLAISLIAMRAAFGFGLQSVGWWILAAIGGVYALGIFIALVLFCGGLFVEYGRFLNPLKWIAYFLSGGSAKLSAEDLARLECTGNCEPDPSKERKTIFLWYEAFKAKVCKPMQGPG